MKYFSTSLTREKFVIHDPKIKDQDKASTIALSNRFVAELRNGEGSVVETFVVRGHNMHSVVRMVARIIYTFNQSGPLSSRAKAFDWDKAWDSIVNDYEYAYNPQRWLAIYHEGKCIFEAGERHPFLDVVERCEDENDQDYDFAIPMAEKLLEQTGKPLKIEYDANVALTVHFEDNQGRLGIILRGSNKTTTFSFSSKQKKPEQIMNIPQCLGAAAAFLEGIQLAFLVGMNTEKIRIGLIERFSKEEKQTREGKQRLARLTTEISNLEAAFEVRYRPERPEFHLLVMEAEELGQKILEPPEPKEEDDDADEKNED